jgi:mitochondrial-processing peptidase subunit alpha
MMYQSSHFHSATPLALSLIADTVRHPLFLPDEVDAQRDAAAYELREINLKPEMILPEILHHIAYKDNTLGNPLLCPEERFPYINSSLLMEYINTWFRPDRMVIAGAGMSHAELVRLTEEHFGDLQLPKNREVTVESARYTGGYRFIHRPEEQFNHVYVAFEGVPIHDDDVYTLATIQLLLGGGGSFSAGS